MMGRTALIEKGIPEDYEEDPHIIVAKAGPVFNILER